MCGISVVKDWEKLKRFNLEQIQQSGVEEKESVIASRNVAKDAPKPNHAGVQKEARQTETEDQQEVPSTPVTAPQESQVGNQNGGASEDNLAAGTKNATGLEEPQRCL